MKKILLNPLAVFQENQLLIVGLIITLFGSLIGSLTNSRFDGVLDCHLGSNLMPWFHPFLDNFINIIVSFALFFALSKMINKKSRAIDILNTILISRFPIYLTCAALMNNFMMAPAFKLIENPLLPNLSLSVFEWFIIIISSCLSLFCLIWSIALLFNGFKTSSNFKGVKPIIYFAITVLLAEIISKIIVSLY